MIYKPNFATVVQLFFTDRLIGQLGASQHTVAGYRDTFRLLFQFTDKNLGRIPSELNVEDLDAPFLVTFLEYLEHDRGNSIRTRNTRLSVLRAFFRYVMLNEPSLASHCQRILAIPMKRYERNQVDFLTEEESATLLDAPDISTWIGRRDRVIILVALNTGLRNKEITSLRQKDIEFGTGAHVRCLGKGRKMRCTPLHKDVAVILKQWLSEQDGNPDDPVFPSLKGGSLSADALQRLVTRHVVTASQKCPSIMKKTVTPHTLRHSMAMKLLHNGVDLSVIALWLGHESTETVQIYLHADMKLKEKALEYATLSGKSLKRYKAPDPLLAFLEGL